MRSCLHLDIAAAKKLFILPTVQPNVIIRQSVRVKGFSGEKVRNNERRLLSNIVY